MRDQRHFRSTRPPWLCRTQRQCTCLSRCDLRYEQFAAIFKQKCSPVSSLIVECDFLHSVSVAAHHHCYHHYHYRYLLNDLTSKYRHVEFVNLSIGSLGIFGQSCDSFIQMCSDLTIDKAHTNYIITKLSTIIIRTTYYIFCMRNKPWTNPDLLSY